MYSTTQFARYEVEFARGAEGTIVDANGTYVWQPKQRFNSHVNL